MTELFLELGRLLARDGRRADQEKVTARESLLASMYDADKDFLAKREMLRPKQKTGGSVDAEVQSNASAATSTGASSRESSVEDVREREMAREVIALREEMLTLLRGCQDVMEEDDRAKAQRMGGLRETARKCMYLLLYRAEKVEGSWDLTALAKLTVKFLYALQLKGMGREVALPPGALEKFEELAEVTPEPLKKAEVEDAALMMPAASRTTRVRTAALSLMLKGGPKTGQFTGVQGADVYVQGSPTGDVAAFKELL